MTRSPNRSSMLPLLFAGLLLAAGVAAFLLPLFACPPCRGSGYILQEQSNGDLSLYLCRLCGHRGRVRAWSRLRADPSPELHRGNLSATASGVYTIGH